jgi:hypothetical protein
MSPQNERPQSLRRRCVALVALVACLSMGLSATQAAGQPPGLPPMPPTTIPSVPPPVPECFYTGNDGSPYGQCGGLVIPGGGTVVLFTHPNEKGHGLPYVEFDLSGPAPLQTKQHVACGDMGCVYNHLDWVLYSATPVSGCQTNTSTCEVRVEKGSGWAVVYVRQNTEPKLLYALWPGLPGGIISGTVTDILGDGVPGVTVTAAGPGGGSATTDYSGFYTMDVTAGNYTVTAGAQYDPASADVTVPPNGGASFTEKSYQVGGQVLGVSCSGTSCSPPFGLAGQPVLVQGLSSRGKPVSEVAVSKPGGEWSARVPNGTYNLGPTVDGKAMDLPVYDPEEIPGVAVHNQDVWGNDFQACAAKPSSGSQEGRFEPAGLPAPGPLQPSVCQSRYTVVVSAAWPKKLVDASKDALFNTNPNPDAVGVYQSPHYAKLRRWLGLAPEFPACLAKYPGLVASLTKEGAQFKWYTYYSVDTSTLGQIKFPLVWSWKNQTVDYAATPVAAWGKVTKYWAYEYTLPSKPGVIDRGACFDTRTVRMTTVLAAGGNGGAAGLKPNQFTIEIAWWLPFDPEGVTVDTEGSLGEQIAEYGATLLHKLAAAGSAAAAAVYEKYEAMPAWQKFALGLACGIVAEGLIIKGVVAAPELIAELIGTELPSGTAAFMEHAIGSDLEMAHYLMTAAEVAGFYVGTIKGYPVMNAVVRGSFSATNCVGAPVECISTLALAVSPTKFPDVSVQVVRDVDTRYGRQGFHGPLYTGVLPWKTSYSSGGSEVRTFNPYFGSNKPYLISDASDSKTNYSSGAQAVANVQAGTAQNPQLVQSIRQTLSPAKQFVAAQEALKDPECNEDGTPESPSTICWVMKDGRP